jgi:NADPH-dependent 2,4-dienoyl-CoA reductase/sulfur reductase-like enzyme
MVASDGIRVCIVGTGPAGFYTAKYLLQQLPEARVDLVDALPVPFGTMRAGTRRSVGLRGAEMARTVLWIGLLQGLCDLGLLRTILR